MPYRSSNLRITKQQETSDLLNDTILNYIKNTAGEWEAEAQWLAMRADGNTLSQPTFNNRLKQLVEAGLVERRTVKYNKYLYQAAKKK